MDVIEEPARCTPVHARTQVIVVGGGAAGTTAAVAAARLGADTVLIERDGALGGLATAGLIILLLTLDDGAGQQVVGGLCQEIVERLAARDAAFFPPRQEWGATDPALIERYRQWGLVWGSGPHRVRYSVAYDPEVMRQVLHELVREAGVHLLLRAWGCEALREGDRLIGVAVQTKAGRLAVLGDVVIDTTGDGDIFASAGVPFDREQVLPWLWFRMGVPDPERAVAAAGWCFRTVNPGQLLFPWGAAERAARKIDATDPEALTEALLECRTLVLREVERLKREVPEFRQGHLCDIATALGITESRRLRGRYVLRREDMDRPFPDAVGVTGHWTRYGARYWLPYRSLLSREFANLLVAGRCISVDHRVHHATKEIPAQEYRH